MPGRDDLRGIGTFSAGHTVPQSLFIVVIYIKLLCQHGTAVLFQETMKFALLLTAFSALAMSASIPKAPDDGHHHGVEAFMPSQCPFVNPNTGFRCMGFPMSNGYSVAGEKYRCSNGHTWLVSNR